MRLLNTDEASQILGLAKNTLERWRTFGTGPRYFRIGRTIRYKLSDLESYVGCSLGELGSHNDQEN